MRYFMIAEYYNNGKFKCFWEAYETPSGKIEGVCGFGELYYRKMHCKKVVDTLNHIWKEERFKCVEVKIEVVKPFFS